MVLARGELGERPRRGAVDKSIAIWACLRSAAHLLARPLSLLSRLSLSAHSKRLERRAFVRSARSLQIQLALSGGGGGGKV